MTLSQFITALYFLAVFPSLLSASMPFEMPLSLQSTPEQQRAAVSHLVRTGSLSIRIPIGEVHDDYDDDFWTLRTIENDHRKSCQIPDEISRALEHTGRRLLRLFVETQSSSLFGKDSAAADPVRATLEEVTFNTEGSCQEQVQRLSHSPYQVEEMEHVSISLEAPPGSWYLRVIASADFTESRLVVALWSVDTLAEPTVGYGQFYGRSYRFIFFSDTLVESSTTDREHAVVSDMPSDEFCMGGMNMDMFMRGFQRTFSSSPKPCLVYYFQSWVLSDEGKFKGAMVYSFLLGLLTQGLTVMRAIVVVHVPRKKYILVGIYVLQMFMGYILMFVAMTYSVELLLSVVMGLAFGYFVFHRGKQPGRRNVERAAGIREPLLAQGRSTSTS